LLVQFLHDSEAIAKEWRRKGVHEKKNKGRYKQLKKTNVSCFEKLRTIVKK